jgi:ribulose-phosphate 3-epimerase
MITIAPSLLSANFLDLKSEFNILNKISNLWIHLDIMDNHFVPNLTFGATVLKNMQQITQHKLDAHFMVTDPLSFIEPFSKCNLHNFTFHLETTTHPVEYITKLKNYFPSVGISIKPHTDVTFLTNEILSIVDLVLIMSVEPGFGGQSFMPSSIEKIEYLREQKQTNNYNFIIQVDGGINHETAKLVKAAGAENLVAGSYIFNEPNQNYQARINELR